VSTTFKQRKYIFMSRVIDSRVSLHPHWANSTEVELAQWHCCTGRAARPEKRTKAETHRKWERIEIMIYERTRGKVSKGENSCAMIGYKHDTFISTDSVPPYWLRSISRDILQNSPRH